MARERRPAARIPKDKKTRGIVYCSQDHISNLVKEKSAFARWCEREELRLAAQPGAQDFEKAFKQFEQERAKRTSALSALERRAGEEKQQRRLPWPGPGQEFGVIEGIRAPFSFSRPTFFSETEVSPTKTLIYRGAPASGSHLIYPCPDLRRWSAWFEDDEVTLDQGYRYWFPSTNQHPLKSFFFSGQFVVDTRLTLQGVVAIGTYGYVTVDAATYISVVQCTAADKNHDNGWHYDPNYDQLITDWRSYCDGNQQRFFSDTQPGLHTFGHYIDLPVHVICSCGGPNRFAEITHILTITAVNATCQFGPNVEDCASGSASGWIETYWPTISLEYVGPFPWERALRTQI